MQEDFDIVTLTSENVLDYVDHTQLNLIVGRPHTGRTLMSHVLALMTSEALFDQGITLGGVEGIDCISRPVLVDDEVYPEGLDHAWRGRIFLGLKNWPMVYEQNAHHAYTPSSRCLTVKTPFAYVVHGVSAVFEPGLLNAKGHYESQRTPAPMFLANHRIRDLSTPEVLKPNVHICSMANIEGGYAPNELVGPYDHYGCVLSTLIAKNGRIIVFGFGVKEIDDKQMILPLPHDAVRAALANQVERYTGRQLCSAVDYVEAFKTVMEDKK